MKKMIILATTLLVACGSPKTEEAVAAPACDTTKCADSCAVVTPTAVVEATTIATTTVK